MADGAAVPGRAEPGRMASLRAPAALASGSASVVGTCSRPRRDGRTRYSWARQRHRSDHHACESGDEHRVPGLGCQDPAGAGDVPRLSRDVLAVTLPTAGLLDDVDPICEPA